MRSLLLYANDDSGTLVRLEAALSVAEVLNSHLHCLQMTYSSDYIFVDPFGGIYPMVDILDDMRSKEDQFRAQLEGRLERAGARWTWINAPGNPLGASLDRMKLIDLAIVSIGTDAEAEEPTMAAARLAIRTETPVLAVATEGVPFNLRGNVLVAWNGSTEAARALRAAVPLVKNAASVTIVQVVEDGDWRGAIEAAEYLGYHDIKAEIRQQGNEEGSVADALRRAAVEIDASYIVMGAYGKPRVQERIFGGVTRSFSKKSPCSLFMAH